MRTFNQWQSHNPVIAKKNLLYAGNHGKIVAMDIETGAFQVADDTMTAARRPRELVPDSQTWVVRIGYRAVHRFGARSLKDSL